MEFNFLGKAFKGDKVIWCIFIALCIISLLEVFSATSTIAYRQHSHWGPILRHAAFLLIGFAVVMFLQRVPSRFFSILLLGLPISAILLIITMFMGEDVNGAQRWLGIGAFTIQPSEFAKISAIGFVAFFLSKMKADNEGWIFKTLIIGIGALCLLIAPENLSTACLLFGVCFLMMFIGQVSIKKLGLIALTGIAGVVLILGSLTLMPDEIAKKYLPDRLTTWKNRIERHDDKVSINDLKEDGTLAYKITDENYQVSHAKIAIANGGVIGLPGSGTERDFLPQAYSDFIFAIILEEMGLLGGLFVLLLYVALMIRCGVLASKCEKKFPRYLILGAGLILTIQALANMAVAVNLIPVTGQPLPLVSRGGTSTIITCAYFGIILACSSKLNDQDHEDVDESIANVDFEPTEEPTN
ncbi:FtsW/RodA/SpoVE family cell cycle protein [Dysgonomonas sp. BGC7]|uniref:FtsW/RodA/SpoVE family cell cycle protein n=1 Tax=Dysgonomonas sp. BGC7 TaxID=1658008 RepID=UPI0006813F2D|nr:FtsW/RodA/SpoVE family cell cycle protein [Dysgonomonas sp. BGC7]MBD8387319.1 FtsW/RodA/SpoVE family cell cycle protein [Dysgonomonas sp. BGC7]